MLVFIDESGDPGVKGKPGSSELFIMVAVMFLDNDAAHRCDDRIAQLRISLSRSGKKEYKFNTTNKKQRLEFFRSVDAFSYSYLALVLNKGQLYGPGFQFKKSFYKYTANLLFQNARPYLKDATVVVDRCGAREFRQELSVYLKRKINEEHGCVVRKLKMEASHSNNLIQLADMVAGAVARSFNRDKHDADVYRFAIKSHELHLQIWPKPKRKPANLST
jgi:hypothetical protein